MSTASTASSLSDSAMFETMSQDDFVLLWKAMYSFFTTVRFFAGAALSVCACVVVFRVPVVHGMCSCHLWRLGSERHGVVCGLG